MNVVETKSPAQIAEEIAALQAALQAAKEEEQRAAREAFQAERAERLGRIAAAREEAKQKLLVLADEALHAAAAALTQDEKYPLAKSKGNGWRVGERYCVGVSTDYNAERIELSSGNEIRRYKVRADGKLNQKLINEFVATAYAQVVREAKTRAAATNATTLVEQLKEKHGLHKYSSTVQAERYYNKNCYAPEAGNVYIKIDTQMSVEQADALLAFLAANQIKL